MRSSKCLGVIGSVGILVSAAACSGSADVSTGEATAITTLAETAIHPLARVQLGVFGNIVSQEIDDYDYEEQAGWTLARQGDSPGIPERPAMETVFRVPGAGTKVNRLGPDGARHDYFAAFDGGKWTVDSNASGRHEPADLEFQFGAAGDVPVTGNWSATGLGVYRNGAWYLDTNGNGALDDADAVRFFGTAGDIPVVGDWTGDGTSKIGFYRKGKWWLDWNGNGGWDAGDVIRTFGTGDDIPFVWPGVDGKHEYIGVFDGYDLYTFDSNGNGVRDDSDMSNHYGYTGAASRQSWKVQPMIGHWALDLVPLLLPEDNGVANRARVLHEPYRLALRTSPADPSIKEYVSYETEYLTTVATNFTSVASSRGYVKLGAGGVLRGASVPGITSYLSVVGPEALTLQEYVLETGWCSDCVLRNHMKVWYAAPTEGTLLRWVDLAKLQAEILTRAGNSYLMAKDYRQVGTFNRDQLTVLASSVKLWLDAAKTPAERLKWQGVYDSLIASRDGQPLPVSPEQFQQYLDDLVNNAKADMMMQVERAQAILDMFTKAQTALVNATGSLSADIAANLAASRAKLDAKAAQARPALVQAIAAAPKA